jgi:hypothetical protein
MLAKSTAEQAPSPRRIDNELQVPDHRALTSEDAAGVVTYVSSLPFRIPFEGAKSEKVSAGAEAEKSRRKIERKRLI